jgi:hypothetical protein
MSPGSRAGHETRTDRRRADRASVLAGPAEPARSSRAACRCARSRSTLAHQSESGSSAQRPDHRRCQFRRCQRRNARSNRAGKLNLDRRRRTQCGAISAVVIDRGDHHFRETALATVQLLPPPMDLSGANMGAPGDIGDNRPRRKGRTHNGALLPLTPRSSPFAAGNNLHAGHLDVSCTSASTDACTSATSGLNCRADARRPSPEGYTSLPLGFEQFVLHSSAVRGSSCLRPSRRSESDPGLSIGEMGLRSFGSRL